MWALGVALSGCGGKGYDDGGIDRASSEVRCAAEPDGEFSYKSSSELEKLLVKPWKRCDEPTLYGEEVGIEFVEGGRFYPLAHLDDGELVKLISDVHGHSWSYPAAGDGSRILVDGESVAAPVLTKGPTGLRITLGGKVRHYVWLTQLE